MPAPSMIPASSLCHESTPPMHRESVARSSVPVGTGSLPPAPRPPTCLAHLPLPPQLILMNLAPSLQSASGRLAIPQITHPSAGLSPAEQGSGGNRGPSPHSAHSAEPCAGQLDLPEGHSTPRSHIHPPHSTRSAGEPHSALNHHHGTKSWGTQGPLHASPHHRRPYQPAQ